MLTNKQKKYFRSRAHKLKPVVIIGAAGLTDPVINEIDSSIEHHELIKVRVNASDRTQRKMMVDTICERVNAEAISIIGHIAILYRPAKNPTLKTPR